MWRNAWWRKCGHGALGSAGVIKTSSALFLWIPLSWESSESPKQETGCVSTGYFCRNLILTPWSMVNVSIGSLNKGKPWAGEISKILTDKCGFFSTRLYYDFIPSLEKTLWTVHIASLHNVFLHCIQCASYDIGYGFWSWNSQWWARHQHLNQWEPSSS